MPTRRNVPQHQPRLSVDEQNKRTIAALNAQIADLQKELLDAKESLSQSAERETLLRAQKEKDDAALVALQAEIDGLKVRNMRLSHESTKLKTENRSLHAAETATSTDYWKQKYEQLANQNSQQWWLK